MIAWLVSFLAVLFYENLRGRIIIHFTTSRTRGECCLVAKKVSKVIKLQLNAGRATQAPPVG